MYIPLTSEDFIKLIGQNRNTFHEKYRKKLLKNKFLYRPASLEENNKIDNKILISIFPKRSRLVDITDIKIGKMVGVS